MKIPHLSHIHRSKFHPLVAEALRQSNRLPLTVELRKRGGYKGTVTVVIRKNTEKEFLANREMKDWTRFPARIRAAATALRDAGMIGTYKITHENGSLEIHPG